MPVKHCHEGNFRYFGRKVSLTLEVRSMNVVVDTRVNASLAIWMERIRTTFPFPAHNHDDSYASAPPFSGSRQYEHVPCREVSQAFFRQRKKICTVLQSAFINLQVLHQSGVFSKRPDIIPNRCLSILFPRQTFTL